MEHSAPLPKRIFPDINRHYRTHQSFSVRTPRQCPKQVDNDHLQQLRFKNREVGTIKSLQRPSERLLPQVQSRLVADQAKCVEHVLHGRRWHGNGVRVTVFDFARCTQLRRMWKHSPYSVTYPQGASPAGGGGGGDGCGHDP